MNQSSVNQAPISREEFRSALGLFPTGVAIVTAEGANGEGRVGVTITSFNSVSLEPPLVLFSICRKALSLPVLCNAQSYSINVLGEQGQALSNRFATSKADKWRGTEVIHHENLPFTLADATVAFQCEPWAQHDGGDHVIFVGRVVKIQHQGSESSAPLVFYKGRYAALENPELVLAD